MPTAFALLPFIGLGLEALFCQTDLFFADRQRGWLLLAFGSDLVLQATRVVLELQPFELQLLAFDFEFIADAAIVLGDGGSARFDAAADGFRIDGRQEFGPGFFHGQPSFQRESDRAFHLAAHHLEPLSSSFEFFHFERALFRLLFE